MNKALKVMFISIFYLAYDAGVMLLSFELVYQMILHSSSSLSRSIVLLPILSIALGLLMMVFFKTLGWLTVSLFTKLFPPVCLMALAVFFYGYSQYLLVTVMFSCLIALISKKII